MGFLGKLTMMLRGADAEDLLSPPSFGKHEIAVNEDVLINEERVSQVTEKDPVAQQSVNNLSDVSNEYNGTVISLNRF